MIVLTGTWQGWRRAQRANACDTRPRSTPLPFTCAHVGCGHPTVEGEGICGCCAIAALPIPGMVEAVPWSCGGLRLPSLPF